VERASKFADSHGRKLEIIYESTGRKEDRLMQATVNDLRTSGLPFHKGRMSRYEPLTCADINRILVGDPVRKTKSLVQLQLADLVLYPIIKGKYDPVYPPYVALKEAKKLADDLLPDSRREICGIKYSCFELSN
jgi:hypothetical protein